MLLSVTISRPYRLIQPDIILYHILLTSVRAPPQNAETVVKKSPSLLKSSSILIALYSKMCIQVRVTYQRCSHVHLGYELCPEFNPSDGFCPGFETHPRIDPFCPLCSKLDYRAYKVCLFHHFTICAVMMLICAH